MTNEETIEKIHLRCKLVEATDPSLPGRSSALYCVADARECLRKHLLDVPYPAKRLSEVLPNNWLESALGWSGRAGQHVFGYRTPEGW